METATHICKGSITLFFEYHLSGRIDLAHSTITEDLSSLASELQETALEYGETPSRVSFEVCRPIESKESYPRVNPSEAES